MKNSLTATGAAAFPFARSAAELSGARQRVGYYAWNLAALLVSSAGITVLSLLLGLGMFEIRFFFGYFQNPLLFLLNWIPVLLLQAALYGITGRHWAAYLLTALLVLGASAGSFYKLRFRSEPFVFSDLFILSAALEVAGEFDLTPNLRLILSAISIPLGTLVLLFFAKGRPAWPTRLLLCLGSALAAGVLWVKIYSDESFYRTKAVSNQYVLIERWDEMVFVTKGSVYPFLHSISYVIETPPQNYSQAEAEALLASYPRAEIPADRRVHLLAFQLESFCDYTRFGIQGLKPGFYDLYHALEAESFCGDLIVNTIGGGTINAERCFLTGATRLFPYSAPTNSFVRVLRALSYRTLTDHPHFRNYYTRDDVNAYMGFESFRARDDFYGDRISELSDHWMSDSFLFPDVLDQFEDYASGGDCVFSFTVTTQGHGGYAVPSYEGPEIYWDADGCPEWTKIAVNTYFSKIADTQVQLAAAIERLRNHPEPVAVLVYGDHQPSLNSCEGFFDAAGLDFSPNTKKGLLDSYTTRYLLWVNEAARELLGDDLAGEGPTVSPCFLMGLVFEKLGWRGSAFMQLGQEVRSQISVINDNGFYLTSDGVTDTLTAKQAALLHDLECAQYYMRTHFSESGEP